MPNSAVFLDIKSNSVSAEIQLPLNELELAFGSHVNDSNSATLVKRLGPALKRYLLKHIHPVSPDGKAWTVNIYDLLVQPVAQSPSGPYRELTVHLLLQPSSGESSRNFTLNYDVIVHQVVTHVTLVSVRQDWDNALYAGHPVQVGVIRLDPVNNVIPPLVVNQAGGSIWTGFKSMVGLGMQHIAEGTDHLLFLLVLLLPAPLLISKKYHRFNQSTTHREEVTKPSYSLLSLEKEPDLTTTRNWGKYGGLRYSLMHILRVVTAFTIGHSITLALGVMGWIHAPGQVIEVLIAISILVSAIHALYPVFPHKEMYIAGGFGLIHGMAFASTLANLDLETSRLVLSILGFNIGIELMQLFVIAMVIPWLILLSRLPVYRFIRIIGALFAGIAAIAWIAERISSRPNTVSAFIFQNTGYAPYLIAVLALVTAISYLAYPKPKKNQPIRTFSQWPPVV
ncbi:MAG: HupE/UreJ family protein [Hymenobacter sp.]|nr:MAG: HupE/UreJ family protein [Hymenobacter sp.]